MTFPQIAIMVACVILSAFFSATETAFSTLNKTKVKTQAERGSRRAALVCRLHESYDKLLSTILIGNNIVNITLASVATMAFVEALTHLDEDMSTTISTAVTTVVVLIFGEITPKSVAKDCPEKFASFAAPMMLFLTWVFAPVNFLFSLWKKLVSRIFRLKGDNRMSQEELLMLVEEVEQEGSIDTGEGDLLRNAIEFTDLRAEDILTHRVELEGFALGTEKAEISRLFYETKYSRLMVYEDTIDHIVGILHQKDFYTENGITQKPIASIMTPPVFIHKTERVRALLRELQTNKSHVAVVIDEYGGTLGIVTMEDILEELVGEIWDEHDEVVETFLELGEDKYRVDCSVSLDDFCDKFDISPQSDSVSLGGWISEELDKIPEVGDVFTFANLEVSVVEVDSHRPTFAQVVCLTPQEEAE